MNLLQFAFEEGRDTKLTWKTSESLKKAHLMELQATNLISNKKHKGTKRKIAQINPKTGKVVNVFASAFSVARWINASRNKNPILTTSYKIHGNVRIQMLKGGLAYGFYWVFLEPDSTAEVTKHMPRKIRKTPTHKAILLLENNVTHVQHKINGFQLAAERMGVGKGTLNRRIVEDGEYVSGTYTATVLDRVPVATSGRPVIIRNKKGQYKKRFGSYVEAAKYLKLPPANVRYMVRHGRAKKASPYKGVRVYAE